MIQEINIQGYQSHKNTRIEFHPGVNVVVGESDSGKTAIVRALRWVKDNRPGGDAFRSNWGGDTIVDIKVDGQHVIRGKDTENYYKLGEHTFKAIKTNVPEEIQKTLNLEDTNLQRQLDAPFLIDSSPGEVAAYFNKVAHLEEIDLATSNVLSAIRTITAKNKADEDSIENLQKDLDGFNYLDKLEIELEVLEQVHSKMVRDVQAKNSLDTTINSIEDLDKQIEVQNKTAKYKSEVDIILDKIKKEAEWKKQLEEFNGIVQRLEELDNKVGELKNVRAIKTKVEAVLKLWKQKTKETEQLETLNELIDKTQQTTLDSKTTKERLGTLKKLFDKNMPSRCPLCNK